MTPRSTPWWVVVSLALALLGGAGTVLFTYGLLSEYGTTTGSWSRGALDGLRFAFLGIVLTGALAAIVLVPARGPRVLRLLAVTVVVLTAGGAAVAGAAAAEAKYDRLPRGVSCLDEEMVGGPAEPVVRQLQEAYDEMDHPARLGGGGSSGIDGCSSSLLDVTFAQASRHYRHELPSLGWRITRDDGAVLEARRGELRFVLARGQEPAWVPITVRSSRIETCDGLREREWEGCMFGTGPRPSASP